MPPQFRVHGSLRLVFEHVGHLDPWVCASQGGGTPLALGPTDASCPLTMNVDFASISSGKAYHLMTQTVVPRPIAWVLSDNGDGTYNLAPFSYFMGVTSTPPTLAFSVGHKPDGSVKDTWKNIDARKNFVVHIPKVACAAEVSLTAATLEHGVSEVMHAGLSLAEFEGFELPRVVEAGVAFGCTLDRIVEVGEGPHALILGQAKCAYVDDDVTGMDAKGRLQIDATRLDPLARLGGAFYAGLSEPFEVTRPK